METCNSEELELGLPPPTIDSISEMIYRNAMMDEQTRQESPITIFYDGRVYVFDVMELQIRAIILVATREMEGGMMSSKTSNEAVSLALQSQILIRPPPCNSVKKSLHTFLKNRKNEASAPYSHNSCS